MKNHSMKTISKHIRSFLKENKLLGIVSSFGLWFYLNLISHGKSVFDARRKRIGIGPFERTVLAQSFSFWAC